MELIHTGVLRTLPGAILTPDTKMKEAAEHGERMTCLLLTGTQLAAVNTYFTDVLRP